MRKALPVLLLLALLATLVAAQTAPDPATAKALKRFDDQKFGLFIHWGLYAIPAGEWKGKYVRGIGEWIMFREKIPVAEYEQLATKFNPVKFDAQSWAQVAQDAGMKYVVITSKHHDGFAMFGSKASKYNIVDASPFRRDPLKELSAAVTKKGLDFGFYYSQDQDWHEAGGRGNDWDFPKERDAQPYLEGKVFPQVKELLAGYGKLGLIWFDTPGLLSLDQVTELRAQVKAAQPQCLINSRIGHGKGDYTQTGDNAIPIQVYTKDGKWEVPATLNDTWGFKANDTNWKDPRDLIAKLADIVSKGGNYLLNVGPTAEGEIPQASQQILRTIGDWLKANGESIYGTRPSPLHYRGITWRATWRPGKLYFHILNWPGTRLRIAGIDNEPTKAYFLSTKEPVKFRRTGGSLDFELPAQPVDPYDTVIVVEYAGGPVQVANGYRADQVPSRLDLHAWVARLRGEEIRYDWKTQSASGFKEAASERNSLLWYPYKSLNGEYEVELTYSCENAQAGSKFRVSSRLGAGQDSTLRGEIEPTDGKFVAKKMLGKLTVRPETDTITFALEGDDKSAAVKVHKLTLSRVAP